MKIKNKINIFLIVHLIMCVINYGAILAECGNDLFKSANSSARDYRRDCIFSAAVVLIPVAGEIWAAILSDFYFDGLAYTHEGWLQRKAAAKIEWRDYQR